MTYGGRVPNGPALRVAKVRTARIALRRVSARVVPRERLLPGYLIVGSKRCGTSSLHEYLTQHPDVLPPFVAKGSRYFDVSYPRGWRWYVSHFPSQRTATAHARRTGTTPLTGEASPYYVFHPAAPARIAAHLPDVRLLLLVRDPVERAWSHHRYEVARGFETLDVHAALDAEQDRLAGEADKLLADPAYRSFAHRHHSYLARGRYAEQLEHLFTSVPRERVLTMSSEQLFADPVGTVNTAYRFLGLREYDGIDGRPYKANDAQAIPADVRERLATYYAPHNRRLTELLGVDFGWTRAAEDVAGGASR